MKFALSLILLLCAHVISMQENNKIVPKSLEPSLKWIDTLKMVGNCRNLSLLNSKWNQFCNDHFDELYNHYVSSFVETSGQSYGMVEGPFPGLMMIEKSNFLGVYRIGNSEEWIAKRWSKIQNKYVCYGTYNDEQTAAHASDTMARTSMKSGETKKLNFPDDDTYVHPNPLNEEQKTERMEKFLIGPNHKGCILDLSKTLVAFRFRNREYALEKIVQVVPHQLIHFVYKTIDNGIKDHINIRYEIRNLPMEGKFSAPQGHFIRGFPLMEVFFVHSNLVRYIYEDNITTAFMDADIKPRFTPEFSQTLLKQQKKTYQ